MTWKEFKEWVDAQLAEKGASEDTEIWYIDISFPDNTSAHTAVSLSVDEQLGLSIS